MTSSGERNDRGRGRKPFNRSRFERSKSRIDLDGGEWVWGRHAALAALANPARRPIQRILATAEMARLIKAPPEDARIDIVQAGDISNALPPGAVHQGLAAIVAPLEPLSVEDLAEPAEGVILMLDQVTDPQNVGALLRSAAAFGAKGVVIQDRNAPPFSGALAKAAAGAVETIPVARVVNLSRALEALADHGWRAVGLAGEGAEPLAQALAAPGPVVLVMGSEGEGLRRLVAEHCDVLAHIPMPGGFESLNVSAAAAIALYEASVRRALPVGEPG